MFEIGTLHSKHEILSALERLEGEISSLMEAFSEQEFFTSQGGYWSPAEHLRHLIKSVRAVTFGLSRPRLLLLSFGWSFRGSRGYQEVYDQYQAALAAGGTAGRFTPSKTPPDLTPSAWRRSILDGWLEGSQALRVAIERWQDGQLDRYRLPHPLIGKLTVREMLFFTAFHNAHHAKRVVERTIPR